MKNKTLGVVFIAVLLITTLTGCGVVNDLKDVSDSGHAFMTALSDSDHMTSWNMLTSDVQAEIGGFESWQEWAGFRNFDEWSFNNTQVDNGVGQLDGEATLDGESYQVILIFDKVDEAWQVSGISIE